MPCIVIAQRSPAAIHLPPPASRITCSECIQRERERERDRERESERERVSECVRENAALTTCPAAPAARIADY